MYVTEILARCSEMESRMAKLYRTLARRFEQSSDQAQLWQELALEDETHADVLLRELRNFEEGEESSAYAPEFADRVAEAHRRLGDLERQGQALSSLDDATELALAIEQVALEDLYDDLVLQGPPAFRLICERVEAVLSARPANDVPGLPRKNRRKLPLGL